MQGGPDEREDLGGVEIDGRIQHPLRDFHGDDGDHRVRVPAPRHEAAAPAGKGLHHPAPAAALLEARLDGRPYLRDLVLDRDPRQGEHAGPRGPDVDRALAVLAHAVHDARQRLRYGHVGRGKEGRDEREAVPEDGRRVVRAVEEIVQGERLRPAAGQNRVVHGRARRGARLPGAPHADEPRRVHHAPHHELEQKHPRVEHLGQETAHPGEPLHGRAQRHAGRAGHGRLPDRVPDPHGGRVEPVGAAGRVGPEKAAAHLAVIPHVRGLHGHRDVVLVEVLEGQHAGIEHLRARPAEHEGEPLQLREGHEVRPARVRGAAPVRAHAVDSQARVAALEQDPEFAELRRVVLVVAVLEVGAQRVRVRIAGVEHVVPRVHGGDPRRPVIERDVHAVRLVPRRVLEGHARFRQRRQLLVDAVQAEHVGLAPLHALHLHRVRPAPQVDRGEDGVAGHRKRLVEQAHVGGQARPHLHRLREHARHARGPLAQRALRPGIHQPEHGHPARLQQIGRGGRGPAHAEHRGRPPGLHGPGRPGLQRAVLLQDGDALPPSPRPRQHEVLPAAPRDARRHAERHARGGAETGQLAVPRGAGPHVLPAPWDQPHRRIQLPAGPPRDAVGRRQRGLVRRGAQARRGRLVPRVRPAHRFHVQVHARARVQAGRIRRREQHLQRVVLLLRVGRHAGHGQDRARDADARMRRVRAAAAEHPRGLHGAGRLPAREGADIQIVHARVRHGRHPEARVHRVGPGLGLGLGPVVVRQVVRQRPVRHGVQPVRQPHHRRRRVRREDQPAAQELRKPAVGHRVAGGGGPGQELLHHHQRDVDPVVDGQPQTAHGGRQVVEEGGKVGRAQQQLVLPRVARQPASHGRPPRNHRHQLHQRVHQIVHRLRQIQVQERVHEKVDGRAEGPAEVAQEVRAQRRKLPDAPHARQHVDHRLLRMQAHAPLAEDEGVHKVEEGRAQVPREVHQRGRHLQHGLDLVHHDGQQALDPHRFQKPDHAVPDRKDPLQQQVHHLERDQNHLVHPRAQVLVVNVYAPGPHRRILRVCHVQHRKCRKEHGQKEPPLHEQAHGVGNDLQARRHRAGNHAHETRQRLSRRVLAQRRGSRGEHPQRVCHQRHRAEPDQRNAGWYRKGLETHRAQTAV